jgi:hexosaminidase
VERDLIPVGKLDLDDPLKDFLSSFFLGQGTLPVIFEAKSPAKARSNEGFYHLSISKEGITIAGNRANALAALLRLIVTKDQQTYLPCLTDEQEPLYPWRGVLLDEARHYFGKKEVERLLDQMFLLHYNVLHWHLSDDQGFRLFLKAYPDLAKATSREDTLEGWAGGKAKKVQGPYQFAYSEDEIASILIYAQNRGIEIVPEIDVPGHLSAILSAHPEFSCGKTPIPVSDHFGIHDATLCLGNVEARQYLIGLIDEVAYRFKAKHFHLGFDEIKTDEMKKCAACQKRIKEAGLRNEKELIHLFQKELTAHLRSRGIVPLFWNDGMKEKEDDAIEEVWETCKPGAKKRAIRQINAGQKALIAPFFKTYASNAYALMPLRKTFAFNPLLKGIKKPENVLGSELCYWSEYGTSAAKLHFEFDLRSAILAATLWGEKKGTYANFMADLQVKSRFYFGQEIRIEETLMNPRGFKRLAQLRRYFHDVDSEYRRYHP